MALKVPKTLQSTPVVSNKALKLASDLAYIDLTKFRFRIGCALIGLGIVVFFLGHSVELSRHFTSDFTARSWTLTKAMLALGVAFAGKEVVQALGSAIKSIWTQDGVGT